MSGCTRQFRWTFISEKFLRYTPNKGAEVLLTQEKAINSLHVLLYVPFHNFDALPEMNLYIQHTNEK